MKKRLHILIIWIPLLYAFHVNGQDYPSAAPEIEVQVTQMVPLTTSETNNSISAVTNCGADTVRYVRDGKATSFVGITMNVPSEFAGYSQYYDAPQEITVSGLVFYAGVNSVNAADTAIVKCRVYEANPDSSLGAVLTEKDITVYNNYFPSNIDLMKYTVEFDSVAICNQAYYVSIWTETTLPLGIMTDDYNANDGQDEGLGYWYWTGDSTWYASGEFFVWDVDWLIEPIVDYVLTDSLTLSTDSICIPDNTCGIHTRSPIFENRMYNQYAFGLTPELGDSFDWGDGTVTTGFDSCHTYSSIGQFTVDYTATILGWTSSCSVSSYDTLYAGDTPTAAFSSVPTGLSVGFTNTSLGLPDSLLWDFGDGNTSNQTDPTHLYTNSGTYTVCLIAENSCGADTTCSSVTICALPDASFSYSGTPYCPVGTATVSLGAGASAGVYSSSPGLVINPSTGEIDLVGSTDGLYTVTNDIAAAGVCVSASANTTITVLPILTGNDNTTICATGSITINGNVYDAATSTGTEVFTGVGPGSCDSTVTIALNVLPALAGTHDETICDGGSIVVNGTTYNSGNLTGTEVFTGVGPNSCDSTVIVTLTIEAPIDATVDNTLAPVLTANQTGASYQWVDCNNGNSPIPLATNQSYTATVNGNYAVEVTVGLCMVTSGCENITGVGINEVSGNVVSIYPNPTSGMFTISLADTKEAVNYTITTLEGRIVKQVNNIKTNSIEVDLTEESKGVYLLRMTEGNTNNVYKIIRE